MTAEATSGQPRAIATAGEHVTLFFEPEPNSHGARTMRTLFPIVPLDRRSAERARCTFGGLASAAMAQVPAVDWKAEQAEILRHYRALLQIDTSNPPGNEIKAVEYLKKVFEAEGIPTKTFALDPDRPNLVARSRATAASGRC